MKTIQDKHYVLYMIVLVEKNSNTYSYLFAICYISSLPQFHDGGILELMEASQEQHQHLSYQQRTKLFYMVGISRLQNQAFFPWTYQSHPPEKKSSSGYAQLYLESICLSNCYGSKLLVIYPPWSLHLFAAHPIYFNNRSLVIKVNTSTRSPIEDICSKNTFDKSKQSIFLQISAQPVSEIYCVASLNQHTTFTLQRYLQDSYHKLPAYKPIFSS